MPGGRAHSPPENLVLERLHKVVGPAYAGMTFPRFRPLLDELGSNARVVAAGGRLLWTSGEPVCLGLAQIHPTRPSAAVLSLYVARTYRGRGIGTALLAFLEDELRQHGCEKVFLRYWSDKPFVPGLERVLSRCDWEKPQVWRLEYQTMVYRGVREAPWVQRTGYPPGFEVFPWHELKPAERAALEAEAPIGLPGGFVSPLGGEEMIEPLNSLGLRYRGAVVGWVIVHRFAPDRLYYHALYVRPGFQRMGRALPLLARALRLQAAAGIDHLVFRVLPHNAAMMRFLNRHVVPYCDVEASEMLLSHKRLCARSTKSQPGEV